MYRTIITGIDVGTSTVKVVIASGKERDERGFPKIIGIGNAPTHGMRHGYVVNPSEVATSIRLAVKSAEERSGIKVKKAFIGISGIGLNSLVVSSHIMTSRADAEITNLDIQRLHEQCEKDIPRAAIANRRIIYAIPIHYKIDGFLSLGKPEGLKGNKIELKTLFITCLEHHAADLIQAVNESGIEVEDVMASPIASGYATISKSQKIAGCLVANIGSETTSIAVFENNIPTSLEVFPIGGTDITNDIALGLKVPLEEADQIKIGAITGSSYPRKKLEEIIIARLGDIFELIEGHLKKIGRNGLLPAGITIVGGTAALSAIDIMARTSLKLPSRIGSTLGLSDKQSSKDAMWAAAYGLCIWGIHSDEEPGNIETTFNTLAKRAWRRVSDWVKQFLP